MNKKVIKDTVSYKFEIKKSIFITHLFYVENQQQVDDYINLYSKKDAKHNCFAFILDNNGSVIKRCSDDGEPQGTAGIPMLSILENNNLTNILALVTRYFGGIRLGASNLLLQYKNSVSNAIKEAELLDYLEGYLLEISCEFNQIKSVDYILNNFINKEIKREYLESVIINVVIVGDQKESFINLLNTATSGNICIKEIAKGMYKF